MASQTQAGGYADVLVGLQYGDEGKAKIIDLLAPGYDCIARFNGGANAGHTIETDRGVVALKQVPSGIFHENTLLYIGSGCAVNAVKLADELEMIRGLSVTLEGRLWIAARAALIQPHHVVMDRALFGRIGTTKNGIGAAYADRALRIVGERLVSVRLGDVVDQPAQFFPIVQQNLEATLRAHPEVECDVAREMEQLREGVAKVAPFLQPDGLYLTKHLARGGRVLFEGAQSTALDVTHGTVPYVTSSNTMASAAFLGGDAPVRYHRKTIGVTKALMSRVGNGPFVSEYGGAKSETYCDETVDGKVAHPREQEAALDVQTELKSDDAFRVGRALRILSGEYGTGTRRPRRIGKFDLVQLRHTSAMNGVDELYINKCDLLHHLGETREGGLPLITGYKLDGKVIDYEPTTDAAHRRVEPIIELLPAFKTDVSSARVEADLPRELVGWIRAVEKHVGCRVAGIGVGPSREAMCKL